MKSIKATILLCMSLTVLISLFALGAISVYLNYSSSLQMLKQTMTEMAKIASERVEQELYAYSNVAIDAGCTARLADASQSVAEKQKILNQRVAAHGFMRGNIIGLDGISIFDGKDYSDRVYYQKAMTGVSYVSEPLLSKITGEYSIMVAAPLWENGVPNSKIVGVVYFVPPETFLNDIVSDVHISENGAAYAINAQGVTIADNTMDTISVQNIEEEAKTDPSLKMLAAIHGKMRQGESGFSAYQINGVNKFSAYAPIGGTDGWSIGITAPQADFMDATFITIFITLALLLLSIVIAVLIAYRLANGIGKPVRLCADRLKKMAEGDLKTDVPEIKRQDEIGILAEATGTIVNTVNRIIGDIDWGLGELASGNFTVDSQEKELYIGDFQSLAESMYKIISRLSGTLSQINRSADQVSAGSEQVSAGAQALSQGATEQASSVEELAATINEISSHVKKTAENARMASQQAMTTASELEQGKKQMEQMTSAMNRIGGSSAEISKIIKTIEDIAFQTNILALNAAVEAARAGAAGKGFAVVADEVRNLASKSAEASKNTASLIAATVRSVEEGIEIAGQTAASIDRIVVSSEESAKLIHEISGAAQEQASSIAQVTVGVDQISSVVQTNSATAEESAASSEELSGQAQVLKNLVGKFKLKQTDASAVSPQIPASSAALPRPMDALDY